MRGRLHRFDDAREALDEALAVCLDRKDRYGEVHMRAELGNVEYDVGNESLAAEQWRYALRIADELGLPSPTTYAGDSPIQRRPWTDWCGP